METKATQEAPLDMTDVIHYGDNVHIMSRMPDESIDLVYMDPPYYTQRDHRMLRGSCGAEKHDVAFTDTWESEESYLSYIGDVLTHAHRVLRSTGSIYVHVDTRMSHLVRLQLDSVFGRCAFLNEIVWRYRRWPSKARRFQRLHDVLLFYCRSDTHERPFEELYGYESLADSTRKTFGTRRQVADFSSGSRKPSTTNERSPGPPLSDVWEVGVIAPMGKERVGYPTQKPEALLERVILASSVEGHVVLDPFCGSGTTLAVSKRLGRKYIGIDISATAVAIASNRVDSVRFDSTLSDADRVKARQDASKKRQDDSAPRRRGGSQMVLQW